MHTSQPGVYDGGSGGVGGGTVLAWGSAAAAARDCLHRSRGAGAGRWTAAVALLFTGLLLLSQNYSAAPALWHRPAPVPSVPAPASLVPSAARTVPAGRLPRWPPAAPRPRAPPLRRWPRWLDVLTPAPLLTVPLQEVGAVDGRTVGRQALIPVTVDGGGPYNFLLDSGLTGTVIDPAVASALQLPVSGRTVTGIGGAGRMALETIAISDFRIGGALPAGPVAAALVAVDSGLGSAPRVSGMVGLDLLAKYDVCFDREAASIAFYPPGQGAWSLRGATALQAVLLPNSLLGLKVRATPSDPTGLPATPQDSSHTDASNGPFLGIVDTGAVHTIINLAAAEALGISEEALALPDSDPLLLRFMDGRVRAAPTVSLRIDLCSFEPSPVPRFTSSPVGWTFSTPAGGKCVSFDRPVTVAVSDFNFEELLRLGDRGSYLGPAVLLGQDLLQQHTMLLSGALRQVMFRPSS